MKHIVLCLSFMFACAFTSIAHSMLPQDDEYKTVTLTDNSNLENAAPDSPPNSFEGQLHPDNLPPETKCGHCQSVCLCCVAAPCVAANICCECAAMCTEKTPCCVMSSRGGDCCCTSMLSLLSWIFCCPCSCYCCVKKYRDTDAYNEE